MKPTPVASAFVKVVLGASFLFVWFAALFGELFKCVGSWGGCNRDSIKAMLDSVVAMTDPTQWLAWVIFFFFAFLCFVANKISSRYGILVVCALAVLVLAYVLAYQNGVL